MIPNITPNQAAALAAQSMSAETRFLTDTQCAVWDGHDPAAWYADNFEVRMDLANQTAQLDSFSLCLTDPGSSANLKIRIEKCVAALQPNASPGAGSMYERYEGRAVASGWYVDRQKRSHPFSSPVHLQFDRPAVGNGVGHVRISFTDQEQRRVAAFMSARPA